MSKSKRAEDNSIETRLKLARKSVIEHRQQLTATLQKLFNDDFDRLRDNDQLYLKTFLRGCGVPEAHVQTFLQFKDLLAEDSELLFDRRVSFDTIMALVQLDGPARSEALRVIDYGYPLSAGDVVELKNMAVAADRSDEEAFQHDGSRMIQKAQAERAKQRERKFRTDAAALLVQLEALPRVEDNRLQDARDEIARQAAILLEQLDDLYGGDFTRIEDWGTITDATERKFSEAHYALTLMASGQLKPDHLTISPKDFPFPMNFWARELPEWSALDSVRFLAGETSLEKTFARFGVRPIKKLTAIELCCGLGGEALGIQSARFNLLALYDKDPASLKSIKFNREFWRTRNVNLTDTGTASAAISETLSRTNDGSQIRLDLLAGGFPSAGWSHKGAGEAFKDELFKPTYKLVEEFRPRAFFFETVPGFNTTKHVDFVQRLTHRYTELGYHIDVFPMRYSEFGIPQDRTRIYFVGIEQESAKFLQRPVLRNPIRRTVADLIAQEAFPHRKDFTPTASDDHIPTEQEKYDIWAFNWLEKHGGGLTGDISTAFNKTDGSYKKWAALGFNVREESVRARHVGDDFRYTSLALTPGIFKALQGLPHDWKVSGKTTREQIRQICDATPPVIALAVARTIHAALSREYINLDSPGALDTELTDRHPGLRMQLADYLEPRRQEAHLWRQGILALRGEIPSLVADDFIAQPEPEDALYSQNTVRLGRTFEE